MTADHKSSVGILLRRRKRSSICPSKIDKTKDNDMARNKLTPATECADLAWVGSKANRKAWFVPKKHVNS